MSLVRMNPDTVTAASPREMPPARRSWAAPGLRLCLAGCLAILPAVAARAAVPTPVPADQRGTFDAERAGTHDAANIRTLFWNFGMVGERALH